jgi:fimbrial chaperone protein
LVNAANAAFTVEPPLITLRTSMNEKMAWVTIRHTGGGPMAVDLAVYERELDLEGEIVTNMDRRTPDFTVYPAQIILQPGDRARVQVVYRGKQKVTSDRAYFLYSKEVPLRIPEEAGEEVKVGVQTLMTYYTVLAFETGKPGKLSFVSSKQIGDGKVEVIVENKGAGRVPVDNLVLNISGRDRITGFTGKKNSIMPGQQRRFTFKYGKALTAREVTFGR